VFADALACSGPAEISEARRQIRKTRRWMREGLAAIEHERTYLEAEGFGGSAN
jgi:hypothetical protein